MTHVLAEARSLALHGAVAAKLRSQPEILARARDRVHAWRNDGSTNLYYVDAWTEVLGRSVEEIEAFLVDEGEHARALRQTSPFAGALDPRSRWRILATVPSP